MWDWEGDVLGDGWSVLRRKSRGRHDQNSLNLYLKISIMELKKKITREKGRDFKQHLIKKGFVDEEFRNRFVSSTCLPTKIICRCKMSEKDISRVLFQHYGWMYLSNTHSLGGLCIARQLYTHPSTPHRFDSVCLGC